MKLQTKRCLISPFSTEDLACLFKLHSDTEVNKLIGIGPREKPFVAIQLKHIIQHQTAHGFSAWKITDKKTNDFIGRVGLVYFGTLVNKTTVHAVDDMVELGYALLQPYWKKGLATEVSKAVIDWAFDQTNLTQIVAKTNVLNIASQHVLKKLGFSKKKDLFIEGNKGFLFSLSKPNQAKENTCFPL